MSIFQIIENFNQLLDKSQFSFVSALLVSINLHLSDTIHTSFSTTFWVMYLSEISAGQH